ncbi:uncharacterized protein LOC144444247 [Glandiceps talaboti]
MASLDQVRWSEKSYSIQEIINLFRLPKICKVTSGLYGTEDTETLGNLQVVRIHRQHSQRRVVATDDRGRHFSLPTDWDIPFEVVPINPHNREPTLLSNILESCSLPKKVMFSSQYQVDARHVENNVKIDSDFGPLTLTVTYMEDYLQANAINNGILDEEVLVIPAFMKLEFSIAEGIEDRSPDHWNELQQCYDTMVQQKVNFDKHAGNKDMAMYFPRNVEQNKHNYSYMRPNRTIRISTKK